MNSGYQFSTPSESDASAPLDISFQATQDKMAKLLQSLLDENNTLSNEKVHFGNAKNTISDLMGKFKSNLSGMETEFQGMLDSLKKGQLSSNDIQTLLEAERQRSLYTLQMAEDMKGILESLFSGLNEVLTNVRDRKPITKISVNKLFEFLDVAMESVNAITKLASSAPRFVQSAITLTEDRMQSLSENAALGHFAKIRRDMADFTDLNPYLSDPDHSTGSSKSPFHMKLWGETDSSFRLRRTGTGSVSSLEGIPRNSPLKDGYTTSMSGKGKTDMATSHENDPNEHGDTYASDNEEHTHRQKGIEEGMDSVQMQCNDVGVQTQHYYLRGTGKPHLMITRIASIHIGRNAVRPNVLEKKRSSKSFARGTSSEANTNNVDVNVEDDDNNNDNGNGRQSVDNPMKSGGNILQRKLSGISLNDESSSDDSMDVTGGTSGGKTKTMKQSQSQSQSPVLSSRMRNKKKKTKKRPVSAVVETSRQSSKNHSGKYTVTAAGTGTVNGDVEDDEEDGDGTNNDNDNDIKINDIEEEWKKLLPPEMFQKIQSKLSILIDKEITLEVKETEIKKLDALTKRRFVDFENVVQTKVQERLRAAAAATAIVTVTAVDTMKKEEACDNGDKEDKNKNDTQVLKVNKKSDGRHSFPPSRRTMVRTRDMVISIISAFLYSPKQLAAKKLKIKEERRLRVEKEKEKDRDGDKDRDGEDRNGDIRYRNGGIPEADRDRDIDRTRDRDNEICSEDKHKEQQLLLQQKPSERRIQTQIQIPSLHASTEKDKDKDGKGTTNTGRRIPRIALTDSPVVIPRNVVTANPSTRRSLSPSFTRQGSNINISNAREFIQIPTVGRELASSSRGTNGIGNGKGGTGVGVNNSTSSRSQQQQQQRPLSSSKTRGSARIEKTTTTSTSLSLPVSTQISLMSDDRSGSLGTGVDMGTGMGLAHGEGHAQGVLIRKERSRDYSVISNLLASDSSGNGSSRMSSHLGRCVTNDSSIVAVYPVNTVNKSTSCSDLLGQLQQLQQQKYHHQQHQQRDRHGVTTTTAAAGDYDGDRDREVGSPETWMGTGPMSIAPIQNFDLSAVANPIMFLYEAYGNSLSDVAKARLLASASAELDLTSPTSITKQFIHVNNHIEAMKNRITSLSKYIRKQEELSVSLLILAGTFYNIDNAFLGTVERLFSELGGISVSISFMHAMQAEYRSIFESVSASEQGMFQRLYDTCLPLRSSYEGLLDCQGRLLDLKKVFAEFQKKCRSGFAHFKYDPSTASATADRSTFDTNTITDNDDRVHDSSHFRKELAAAQATTRGLRLQLAQAVIEADNAQFDLLQAVDERDCTPAALLFFAALHDHRFIPSLEQLHSHLGGLKPFVEGVDHMDFPVLRNKLSECLGFLPSVHQYLAKYTTMLHRWKKERNQLYIERARSGLRCDIAMTCPMCTAEGKLLPSSALRLRPASTRGASPPHGTTSTTTATATATVSLPQSAAAADHFQRNATASSYPSQQMQLVGVATADQSFSSSVNHTNKVLRPISASPTKVTLISRSQLSRPKTSTGTRRKSMYTTSK
eukprot:gene1248-2420_t